MKENHAIWQADLHLHTRLSFCAPQTTAADAYLPLCGEEGITVLGFSDHIYPARYITERRIPEGRGAAYALRLKPELEALRTKTEIRLLLGGESEMFYGQEPALTYEEAKDFDYVLLAASHILNMPREYEKYDLSTPEKLRRMVLEQFYNACLLDFPVPVGICHPLYPLCSPYEQEVVDDITDSELADCLTLAAKRNRSIEIHACLFRKGTALDRDGLSPTYLRVLSAAKACGCRFHFGSDAHEPAAFAGTHRLLHLAAEKVGITPEDMWELPIPEARTEEQA